MLTPKEIAQILAITPCVEFLLSFIYLYLVDSNGFLLSLIGLFITLPAMILFYVGLYYGLYSSYKPESMIPVYVFAFFALSYTIYIIRYIMYYEKVKITVIRPPRYVSSATSIATLSDINRRNNNRINILI